MVSCVYILNWTAHNAQFPVCEECAGDRDICM